jgi:hypothetical protein
MGNRMLTNGLGILAAGLLASAISSFLERVAILGDATQFVMGIFDGISVVVFAVALVVLVRSRNAGKVR